MRHPMGLNGDGIVRECPYLCFSWLADARAVRQAAAAARGVRLRMLLLQNGVRVNDGACIPCAVMMSIKCS